MFNFLKKLQASIAELSVFATKTDNIKTILRDSQKDLYRPIIELSTKVASNRNTIDTLQKNQQNLLHVNQKISAHAQNNHENINILKENQKNFTKLLNELSSHLLELNNRISQLGDRVNDSILKQRDLLSGICYKKPDSTMVQPQMMETLGLEQSFREFEKRFPKIWPIYKAALDRGTDSYRGFPEQSCSSGKHREATKFKKFIRPYLCGHVLDVGCGPQPIPLYLENYPVELIHGIDPISTVSDHPFHFVSGVGEFLPWKDGQFDTVISGTTLDHYFLLELGLREAWRVLKKGGHFVAWITHFKGSPAYNPNVDPFEAADEEHLYHIDQKWFDPLMSELNFFLKEDIVYEYPFNYVFLAYEKD